MLIETIVWIFFVLFIVLLSALKQKYFMGFESYRFATKGYYDMKSKPSLSKTLDDKMDYLRQKTESGNDLLTIVVSAIIFVLGFIVMIYSRLPNIYVGLGAALIFSLVFSWVAAGLQFKDCFREFKIIDSFIGYLFASTLMVYVRFIDNMHPLLLILLSILIFLLTRNIKLKH